MTILDATALDATAPVGPPAPPTEPASRSLLQVEGLGVRVGPNRHRDAIGLVHEASLELRRGQTLGLVGESGSGKTTLAKAIAGLLRPPLELSAGSIRLDGQDLTGLPAKSARVLTTSKIAMIFQHPTTALNPRLSIGAQLLAAIGHSSGLGRKQRVYRAVELLDQVQIDQPARRLSFYPHQLSGGQCQRVLIAMAMARDPEILIADEPTTALDVSVQARVLDQIDRLRRERGLAVLLVSHDIGVIAERSDQIAVMDAGRIVESGPARAVLAHPTSARLRGLIDSRRLPAADGAGRLHGQAGDIAVSGVVRHFASAAGGRAAPVKAVDGVSLAVQAGGALGIVGESGSGKTTLARILGGLERADAGLVSVAGVDPAGLRGAERRAWHRRVQYLFQDITASLDPRLDVATLVAQPLLSGPDRLDPAAVRQRVADLLAEVDLVGDLARRYPSELSGGQRQRVGIARALAAEPRILIADEPVSSLDQTVQATIVALLRRLRTERELTYLIVSHDLAIIRALCDEVAVMYQGRFVEVGAPEQVFAHPTHPYTQALVEAIPTKTLQSLAPASKLSR